MNVTAEVRLKYVLEPTVIVWLAQTGESRTVRRPIAGVAKRRFKTAFYLQ